MLKTVIFDVDGVLIDSFDANVKFFQDLMVYFGYEPPTAETYRPLFPVPMKEVIKILTKSENDEEVEKIWLAAKNRVVSYSLDLVSVPKDAPAVLAELEKKYQLGIVTSRVADNVFELPEFVALKPYFKTIVAYEDTVEHKPSPEPLLLAAKRLGVAPDGSVYIGDVVTDIIAAKAAGMKSILYAPEKVGDPDQWTNSFSKIPQLVESIQE